MAAAPWRWPRKSSGPCRGPEGGQYDHLPGSRSTAACHGGRIVQLAAITGRVEWMQSPMTSMTAIERAVAAGEPLGDDQIGHLFEVHDLLTIAGLADQVR